MLTLVLFLYFVCIADAWYCSGIHSVDACVSAQLVTGELVPLCLVDRELVRWLRKYLAQRACSLLRCLLSKADPDNPPESAQWASSKSPSSQSRKSSPVLLGNKMRQKGRKVIHEHAIVLLSTQQHTHTRTGTSDQALLTPAKMDISPGPHRRLVWFILCCVLLNSQGAHKQLGVDGSGFLLCSCVQILPQKLHAAPDLYRLTYPEIWWMGGYVLESDWFTVSGKSAKEPQLHNIGNK